MTKRPERRVEMERLKLRQRMRPCPNKSYLAPKRARQAADIQAMKEGKVTQAQMSWLSGGRGKRLKAIGSPV
jgi:hypothetical protein